MWFLYYEMASPSPPVLFCQILKVQERIFQWLCRLIDRLSFINTYKHVTQSADDFCVDFFFQDHGGGMVVVAELILVTMNCPSPFIAGNFWVIFLEVFVFPSRWRPLHHKSRFVTKIVCFCSMHDATSSILPITFQSVWAFNTFGNCVIE